MAGNDGWMIYGATGYTGTLIAEEAVRRGLRPVLGGRSAEKLRPLAERLNLASVVTDLDDGPGLARAVRGLRLVFHAAGPFVRTSLRMINACLAEGTSYVDITGEIPVFEQTFSFDAQARAKKLFLISGLGFDVIPTDCLALHVSQKLPGATRLELAIAALGRTSAGTAKSALGLLPTGGCVRRGGVMVSYPLGKGAQTVRFSDRPRLALPVPWGDLATAHRTTGIGDVTTLMALPAGLVKVMRVCWPLNSAALPLLRPLLRSQGVLRAAERLIEKRIQGPSEQARQRGRAYLWAKASDARGNQVEAWLETMDGYDFTAVAGVRAIEQLLAGKTVGATTPASALGADFVAALPRTRRLDALPGEAHTPP